MIRLKAGLVWNFPKQVYIQLKFHDPAFLHIRFDLSNIYLRKDLAYLSATKNTKNKIKH
jgi:hypothetical protein